MILDGYTECVQLWDDWIVYRPFTRFDRTAIARMLQSLPEPVGERIERKLVESRIVYATWGCEVDAFGEREFQELRRITFGVGRTKQELEDEKNLFDGAYLLAGWPHFRRFTCAQCRVWHFDPISFQPIRTHWDQSLRKKETGEPVLCETGACPRGHWRDPVSFTPKNRMAFEYHAARQALPPDPIVTRNARIINRATELSRADSATAGRR